MIGQTISHYKIIEKLGEGGMGVVYKAEDIKLRRTVALKFLPAELTRDEPAKTRFIHEAQAASALQHHNICAIHEIDETADRRLFIAMDCYDGETLKRRISRGPLPVNEAIDIAIQVAEGLSEAHSSGMVHRDIKPANIMVTDKGVVKILDFGLAKLAGQTKVTKTGTTVGTVAYMSPEQAKGEELDSRSDIWSLGITLHEMITCRIAFRGDHEQAVVYGIINEDPEPMTSLRAGVPMELERIVTKCLAKDPSERYQSARGFLSDLRPLQKTLASKTWTPRPSVIGGLEPRSKHRPLRSVLRWTVPWLLVPVAVLVGWFIRQPEQKAFDGAEPRARYEIPLPVGGRILNYQHAVALSPDGRQLAFVSATVDTVRRGEVQIFLRRLDQWQATPIPGTKQSVQPVFSPDGRWMVFAKWSSEEWTLQKVALEGGQPITLCACSRPFGACWGTDDRIYFATLSGGIQRVPATGGEPETITKLDEERWEKSHRLPHVLPGANALLFTAVRYRTVLLDWGTAEIWAQSLETGERKLLIEGGSDARYISTGHIVFAREGNLFAVGFDKEELAVTGDPVPVLEGVRHSVNTGGSEREIGAAQYSVSTNGVLAYAPGSVYPKVAYSIVTVDRQGREEPLPIESGDFLALRVSPDGRRMLIFPYYPPWDAWSYDFERGTMRRQTFTGNNVGAIWGPGPENFTFSSYRDGAHTFYFKAFDSGPGVAEQLVPDVKITKQLGPGCWSPDGETMVFVMFNEETGNDIYIVSRDSAPEPFVETKFSENHPGFSPDGSWLCYSSDESGRREVYVRPFPGPGRAVQISTEGGSSPAWSRNGGEIFYRNRGAFWAARVEVHGGLLDAAEPEKLFAGNYMGSSPDRSYDLTADGTFLLIKLPDNKSLLAARAEFFTDRVRVIQNWFIELERIAAAPR